MRYLYILRYLCGLFWLIHPAAFVAAQAAPAPAAPVSLRFGGGPALPLRVEIVEGHAQLHIGSSQASLPVSEVGALQAESVELSGGVSAGVVRLTAATQKAAALLVKKPGSGLTVLWTGRLDAHGDPGERQADALEIRDRDGDGRADIVVGSYDERVRVCGEDRTLLAPRALDPKTLSLRSVLLNRASHRPVSQQLAASADPGAFRTPPLLRALTATGSSSALEAHGAAALTDADATTTWVEGRGLGGRFEFATLSWSAPAHPIVALAVVPVAEGATRPPAARVRSLALLGPAGERWLVSLPDAPNPGQRFWIKPPAPLRWSCLSLGIEEVAAPQGLTAQTHAELAELEAYTTLDSGDGIQQLVTEIGELGTKGDDAIAALSQARGDVTAALLNAWPQLSAIGKRRALRLLFARPSAADVRSEAVLRSALRDGDVEVRMQALKLASGKVPFGGSVLSDLAHTSSVEGDQAAQVLAHSGHPDALQTLLTILVEPGASERPALREAIGAAYQARAKTGAVELAGWLGADAVQKPPAARAALALALASVPAAEQALKQLVSEQAPSAKEFPEQWRLVQAARSAPSDATVDSWLEQLAANAETWMLRSAAIEALHQRSRELGRRAAERALEDPYPRVRAMAVTVLAPLPESIVRLAKNVPEDEWFLVRQAALEKLPDSPQSRAWFESALQDRSPVVRASAIAALARVRAHTSWPHIQPLVDNAEEYPEVLAQGIAFARGLCLQAAAPSLRKLVVRGIAPDAWHADQELALSALETLSSFGGESAKWARDHAVGPSVPKEVQLAAAAAADRPGSCQKR